MCYSCWEDDYAKPEIETPTIRALVPLIQKANPYGALHIVIDDWNLDDDDLAYCETCTNLTDLDREIINLMRSISVEERASAMAFADGFAELKQAP